MALSIAVDAKSPTVNTLKLVAEYCDVKVAFAASGSDVPALTTPEGTLSGTGTIAQYLVSKAGNAELVAQLVGTDAKQQVEISDWISRATTEFAKVDQPACAAMNTALLNRTFLVGTTLTLADLVVFGALHPTVSALAPAELAFLCNLTRWTDYVYLISGAASLYKALNFRKPAFAPPAELFAAPKKAAKEDAKPDAKKDDAKKADAKKGEEKKGAEKKGEEKKGDAKKDEKAKPAEAGGEGKKDKKEKKEKKVREMPTKKEERVCVSQLDIRVGTIVKCEKHPNADSLYVEEIDLGEEKPRQVVSGLVKFIPLERMQGARVLVLCNVKPGNMRDVMSCGMVLCASNEEHTQVDFVVPPEGVPNGEKVVFEGVEGEPEPVLNPKKKHFEKIAPDLKTDANGVPGYKGNPFKTSKGTCKASIVNAFVK
uniref:tRNA-binding domain-containing protein n=1 Tax=Pyramimonas obovata TaxID=1411642 RepID=A0A7S0RH46_9CHLO